MKLEPREGARLLCHKPRVIVTGTSAWWPMSDIRSRLAVLNKLIKECEG